MVQTKIEPCQFFIIAELSGQKMTSGNPGGTDSGWQTRAIQPGPKKAPVVYYSHCLAPERRPRQGKLKVSACPIIP